jgi:transcriptional regulator with XRE-family HTH domain
MEDPLDPKAVADIVRSLRRDLDISQAKLAEILRVNQAAVSQYEVGKILPSTEVLLKMSALASISLPENHELQTVIISAIARRIGVYDGGGWEVFLKKGKIRVIPKWSGLLNVQTEFLEEVKAFLAENPLTFEVPSHLVRILRLYRENHRDPGIVNVLRRAADYIEVELKLDRRAAHDTRRRTSLADIVRDEKRVAALEKRMAKLRAAEAGGAATPESVSKSTRAVRARRSASR